MENVYYIGRHLLMDVPMNYGKGIWPIDNGKLPT